MNNKALQLTHVQLKDFRCFTDVEIDLNSPVVLINGLNGIGKTSLLEALYYGCYLRSFRTHTVKDLIALGKQSFFVKLIVQNSLYDNVLDHTITIGFTGSKRLVKVDNKATVSYKDLLEHYRVVSLTEDDLSLIKGGPQERRAFIDHALMLYNPSFINCMREFNSILEQRNSLLHHHSINEEEYSIWSQKLWQSTQIIQGLRQQLLHKYEIQINELLKDDFPEIASISFSYHAKKESHLAFELFWEKKSQLLTEEKYFKRSLFGAHLDDFYIHFEGKKTKTFASRGQQKMVILLIKAAQIKQLIQEKGPVVFLLDDFMTDFDASRAEKLLSILLKLDCQLIFTSPNQDSTIQSLLNRSCPNFKMISI